MKRLAVIVLLATLVVAAGILMWPHGDRIEPVEESEPFAKKGAPVKPAQPSDVKDKDKDNAPSCAELKKNVESLEFKPDQIPHFLEQAGSQHKRLEEGVAQWVICEALSARSPEPCGLMPTFRLNLRDECENHYIAFEFLRRKFIERLPDEQTTAFTSEFKDQPMIVAVKVWQKILTTPAGQDPCAGYTGGDFSALACEMLSKPDPAACEKAGKAQPAFLCAMLRIMANRLSDPSFNPDREHPEWLWNYRHVKEIFGMSGTEKPACREALADWLDMQCDKRLPY